MLFNSYEFVFLFFPLVLVGYDLKEQSYLFQYT